MLRTPSGALPHGTPRAEEIQLDLILDYRSNVALYPAFHAYFRDHLPPLLAVWGRHDQAFIPAGAEAYKRDLPDAEVHLIEAGYFALETHTPEIAARILEFRERLLIREVIGRRRPATREYPTHMRGSPTRCKFSPSTAV